VDPSHRELARQARDVLSAYRESADLVEVGAYVAGSNPRVDRALRCIQALQTFQRQEPTERSTMSEMLASLRRALGLAPQGPLSKEGSTPASIGLAPHAAAYKEGGSATSIGLAPPGATRG
jgi:flagellum-specific ATP synthase